MIKFTIAILFVGSLTFGAQAQDKLYVRNSDTLRYSYTPVEKLPVDSVAVRKSFLHRLANYFEQSSVDKTFSKKIDFSIIGGPSYSRATNFSIGVLAAGLYRLDRTDSITSPSDVSLFGNVSVSGFYMLGISGNTIFSQNKRRFRYELSFRSAPLDFWGVGYDAGANNPRSSYVSKNVNVSALYLHNVIGLAFVGAQLTMSYDKGVKFTNEAYLNGEAHSYFATGVGAVAGYDSRDFIPNPTRGVYVSLQESAYPDFLGNCGGWLWQTKFTFSAYKGVWCGGTIAGNIYGEFNSEGTPWCMLAKIGSGGTMRGYYQGQYSDNDMVTMQVELRQKIYRRIGGVAWVGAGNVFERLSRFQWSQTLPNYGVGFRWEFKKRVNIRIDYGFGRKTSGFVVNVNEAF